MKRALLFAVGVFACGGGSRSALDPHALDVAMRVDGQWQLTHMDDQALASLHSFLAYATHKEGAELDSIVDGYRQHPEVITLSVSNGVTSVFDRGKLVSRTHSVVVGGRDNTVVVSRVGRDEVDGRSVDGEEVSVVVVGDDAIEVADHGAWSYRRVRSTAQSAATAVAAPAQVATVAARAEAPRPASPLPAVPCVSSPPAPFVRTSPSKDECVQADVRAQELRDKRSLLAARAQLLVCASASCGSLSAECAKLLDEVSASLPTIVFEAKDGAGDDLSAVTVTMDGAALTDCLDGKSLEVDPGAHGFRFVTAGAPPVDKQFVIREGEKNRREKIVLGR